MKKVIFLSIILVSLYLLLIYHELYQTSDNLRQNFDYQKLLLKDWNFEGDVYINENFRVYVEGNIIRKNNINNIELLVSPKMDGQYNTGVEFELKGEISNKQVVIHKSMMNNQEIVFTIEEFIDLFGGEMSETIIQVNNQESLIEKFDFDLVNILEVKTKTLIKNTAIQYKGSKIVNESMLEFMLITRKKEIYDINVKFLNKDNVLFNICLHQSSI